MIPFPLCYDFLVLLPIIAKRNPALIAQHIPNKPILTEFHGDASPYARVTSMPSLLPKIQRIRNTIAMVMLTTCPIQHSLVAFSPFNSAHPITSSNKLTRYTPPMNKGMTSDSNGIGIYLLISTCPVYSIILRSCTQQGEPSAKEPLPQVSVPQHRQPFQRLVHHQEGDVGDEQQQQIHPAGGVQ